MSDNTNSQIQPGTFMAGSAKGDITPPKSMLPMPFFLILKFRRILYHVYARVLALSDGGQEYLFITLDMMGVPEAEKTLAFVSKETGIPEKNIFIAATHTHGVTPLFQAHNKKQEKWYEIIKTTLLSTIAEARSKMVPARYGYGEGQSYINVNRDLDGEKSVLGSNYDRPSDHTIRMVRIEDLNGKVIAFVINHATHSVITNGAITRLGATWTGDLAGITSVKIEDAVEGAVALWTMGAAGDQNPRIMAQFGLQIAEERKAPKNLGKVAFAMLEYVSEEHVRDIMAANRNIESDQTSPAIYTAERIVPVPTKTGDEDIAYKLRLFTLGDIAIQGISAEIVTSIGKAVTETSPYRNTMLVTVANGYNGYVADKWEHEHEAFEVGSSRTVEGEAQKAFVNTFTEMFHAHREKPLSDNMLED